MPRPEGLSVQLPEMAKPSIPIEKPSRREEPLIPFDPTIPIRLPQPSVPVPVPREPVPAR